VVLERYEAEKTYTIYAKVSECRSIIFALNLLERMLAFDPKDHPTAEEVVILRRLFSCVFFPSLLTSSTSS
jgi:hypothetical protein